MSLSSDFFEEPVSFLQKYALSPAGWGARRCYQNLEGSERNQYLERRQ